MIAVDLNEADFQYDIHSLVRAFYPDQKVVFDQTDEAPLFTLTVQYHNRSITASITDGDRKLLQDETEVFYEDKKDQSQRFDTKNRLKRLLYRMLCTHTSKSLPWGTLTGIRPTKIPMKALNEGMDEADVRRMMQETYLISDEKCNLAMQVAQSEKKILSRLDPKSGYSLYVSIPFCPTRCLYCSFPSYPVEKWQKDMPQYLSALKKEITFAAEQMQGRKLQTIYFGGGTPSALSASELEEILTAIEEAFDLSHLVEYTVECGRPDSITKEKLQVLKGHGVDRISINPQTMNQKTLDLIGRAHSVEQTIEAFHLARECGFENINMDLILGLPGEKSEHVRHTLEEVKKLRPDSLTVHSLAIKRAARLTEEYERFEKYGMENSDDLMQLCAEAAEEIDLAPYYMYRQKNMAGNLENVGYAAKGKEGIYNILIMEEVQTIWSIGAAGMTKFVESGRPVRVENVKDVTNYISRIDEMIKRKKEGLYGIKKETGYRNEGYSS